MIKIKAIARAYNEYVNKELAKILNMVFSPYLHARIHTRTHTRAHVHVCNTWRSHMSPRGAIIFVRVT